MSKNKTKVFHRKIDFNYDRDYILERHCRINYECDAPHKRNMPYQKYRNEWFAMPGQLDSFINALVVSMKDARTIAEIIENEFGRKIAYIWASFHPNSASGFHYAELQEIYVEEEFRADGTAVMLMDYVEKRSKANGAKLLRSATGVANIKSIELHKKMGYAQYRIEFEKMLK